MSPTLWSSYEGIPVPVKYSKGLVETYFEQEYKKERLAACIDALNTVYVAFTRAKEEMIVFAPQAKLNKSGETTVAAVSDILYKYCNEKCTPVSDGRMVLGESGCTRKEEKSSGKMQLGKVFQLGLLEKRTRTAAQSGSLQGGESIREHGIAMHYVFSLVEYYEDIAGAVERACAEGVATCSREELLEMVERKVASVREYGWFGKEYKVLNECSILTPSGEEKRPDRVLVKGNEAIVIDYKFGAYSQEESAQLGGYKKQVSRYKELLTAMGYANVKGYLWYLSADMVISV